MRDTGPSTNVLTMRSPSVGRACYVAALVCAAVVMWSFMYPTSAIAEPSGEKPAIVLVHGAWADTSSWNGEVEELQRQGYVVRAIANPLENLTTDSETVADFLRTVDGPIVLV